MLVLSAGDWAAPTGGWRLRGACHRGRVDVLSTAFDTTRARLVARFGARVEPWWQRLPGVLGELAVRWDLVLGDAVGHGNTSLVIRCQRVEGQPAMLKLTPDSSLAAAEASALRSWAASRRVPLVWGFDLAAGALLLEALPDETPLSRFARKFRYVTWPVLLPRCTAAARRSLPTA